jgi:hypothetical protein
MGTLNIYIYIFILIDWRLTRTLAVFQLYRGVHIYMINMHNN